MAANGRLPNTALETVAPHTQLVRPAANAYRTLVLLAHVLDIAVRPAPGLGSGYRDIAMQQLYRRAAAGDPDARAQVQLSGSSSIRIASPGYSPHGTGTRIDMTFNGHDHPNAVHLAVANHCGWTREFKEDDPDHFMHDGHTAVSGPSESDWVRILAHYYNSRHLGRTTAAEKDGTFDKEREQNYTWLVQAAGIRDGIYQSPPYLHDGVWGPHTDKTNLHYRNILWNS